MRFLVLVFVLCLTSCSDIFNFSDDPEILTCDDFDEDIKLEHKEGREVDYIIDCLVEVDDIDIEILENVVIEFTEGSGLIIRGTASLGIVSLIQDEPITLRGQENKPGFWKGIHLAGDHNNNARIRNGIISDAGDPNDPRFKGAITSSTHAWIIGTKISNIKGYGIYIDDYAKVREGLVALDISNCSSYPISVPVPQWEQFYIPVPPRGDLYSELHIADCKPNKIEVRGSDVEELKNVNGDIIGIPYPYVVKGDVVIPKASRLIFHPGTNIEMQEKTRIYVYGSFISKGESGNPAIIAGQEDRPGFWGGIYIDRPTAQSANKIEYLHILNGGGGTFENANITLKTGIYVVENCKISKSSSCGLRYFDGNVRLREMNNVFADNAGGGLCEN